ncbi:MAG: TOBE-like domain-containing protein [Polyangiaceae bacterium]
MTIEVRSLEKSFGKERVVDDVSFAVKNGEFVALLGPSGGGKSTVLRIIAGLETPDRGQVLIFDKDATHQRVQDRAVGFVFQHYALFKHMTVRRNIAFGLEVRGDPKPDVDRTVDELLELVQLRGLGNRLPSQLSGGQRQRVALARALAPRPAVILLDEPFGALDAKVRVELRSWLRTLQKERGITSIFVTHDQEEAMELADRVVILNRGKVEQIGSPEDVYDHPETPFVASFMGSSNVLRSSRGLPFSAPEPARADGESRAVRAFVRHHQIEILPLGSEPRGMVVVPATVQRVSRVGWVAKIELVLDDGQTAIAELPKDQAAAMSLQAGKTVRVGLKEARVFSDDYSI